MDRWRGKTAIVTAAASGIGPAITFALLKNGINVAAIDMTEEKVTKLKNDYSKVQDELKAELNAKQCDVSSEEEICKVFDEIETEMNDVNIVINYAAFCDEFDSLPLILQTNLISYNTCIHKAVDSIYKRKVEGHIFTINSVFGHHIPTKINPLKDKRLRPYKDSKNEIKFHMYMAAKHGTIALTHLIRRQILHVKPAIRVTSISPGFVESDVASTKENVTRLGIEVPTLEPEDIANAIIYALSQREQVQVTELIIQPTGTVP